MSERLHRIATFVAAAPVGAFLDFSVAEEAGELAFRLGFHERHIGNPAIRAIHGGVIGAFLEFSMQAFLVSETGLRPTTVNLSVDYVASSRAEPMTARVAVSKIGRRLAFLEAVGRQQDGARLVSVARGCFTLAPFAEK